MQRIFWRHAQAAWAAQDLERTLTEQGLAQAQAAAAWLKAQGIDYPIYCSEARRAQQTAACYAAPQILAGLNPDGELEDVQNALADIHTEQAIIVGHLPWIGQIVGQMLGKSSGYVEVSTAEIFCLEQQAGIWTLRNHFIP